jgi:hypothetical protein
MRQLIFVFCILAILPLAASMRKQSTAVKGRLRCGSAPAANVKVRLMDKDTGTVGFLDLFKLFI